jgi:hypothetical protein
LDFDPYVAQERRQQMLREIAAYSCIFLIFWDLLFLLEYMSVLYEMDDGEGGDEE